MENHKQPQKREAREKLSALGTATHGVPIVRSTKPRASKGIQNAIGARSKTMDLTKSTLSKPVKVSTSGDSLDPLTTKNKASTKSEVKVDRISQLKDEVSILETTSLEEEFEKVLLATPGRSAHSGITFKPKKSVSQAANIFQSPQDVPSSLNCASKQSPKRSMTCYNFKSSNIRKKSPDSKILEENRTRVSSLIPVKMTEEKKAQKIKATKVENLKPNVVSSSTTAKTDTKQREITLKDLDVNYGPALSVERNLEEILMDSPSVKSSIHSGIILKPKKQSPSPRKNPFISHKDGSSNDDQSSISSYQTGLENKALKPARKTKQGPNNDATKKAAEKTGKQAVQPSKRIVTTRTDKATPSKMLRSKTEATIYTNPRPARPIHKVQSFSRQKPEPLVPKKPAHQAIFDVTALVKGEPKAVLQQTSAHSGVPFKPKKPSTFSAVNAFAHFKSDTSK